MLTSPLSTEQSSTGALASSLDFARKEKRARQFWLTGVVSLLGLQVLIGAVAIYLAHSDKTVAVIPDYYHSAVNWDVTRKARQTYERLGWTIRVQVGEIASGSRPVVVHLLDASGQAVQGVTVSATAFHFARGKEIERLIFREADSGNFIARTSLVQAGQWQLTLRIEGEHGVAERVEEIWVN